GAGGGAARDPAGRHVLRRRVAGVARGRPAADVLLAVPPPVRGQPRRSRLDRRLRRGSRIARGADRKKRPTRRRRRGQGPALTREYLGLAGLDVVFAATGLAALAGIGMVASPRSAVRLAGLAFTIGWTL